MALHIFMTVFAVLSFTRISSFQCENTSIFGIGLQITSIAFIQKMDILSKTFYCFSEKLYFSGFKQMNEVF